MRDFFCLLRLVGDLVSARSEVFGATRPSPWSSQGSSQFRGSGPTHPLRTTRQRTAASSHRDAVRRTARNSGPHGIIEDRHSDELTDYRLMFPLRSLHLELRRTHDGPLERARRVVSRQRKPPVGNRRHSTFRATWNSLRILAERGCPGQSRAKMRDRVRCPR